MKPIENMLPENDALYEALQTLAGDITPEPQFKYKLEDDLKSAHKPRASFQISRRDVFQFAGLTVALALLAFVLSWAIRSLVPPRIPAGPGTATPTLVMPSPTPVGQAAPYVVQRGDTCAKIAADFNISMDDLIAANGLASNCANLQIGMELVIPIQGGIVAPQVEGYDYNSLTLYLKADLPSLPLEANVYTAQPDQHATVESARALALRFGIDGQVYSAPGELPGTTDYMVTAGGPRLYVRSDNYFSYYRDYGRNFIGGGVLTDEQAAAAIADFMGSHGFDFAYSIEPAPQVYGEYYIVPLLDGQALRYDYNLPAGLDITLDNDAQVMSVNGSLPNTQAIGTYGIRSAEEAFQKIIGNAEAGIQESMRSGGMLNVQIWQREYPDGAEVTIYGQVRFFPSAEVGGMPLVTLDDRVVTGNITGLEAAQEGADIEASGHFSMRDGIRIFEVDAWQYSPAEFMSITGTLHQEGSETYLLDTSTNEYPNAANAVKYLIADLPADAPFDTYPPAQLLTVDGMVKDDKIDWTMIQYFPDGMAGGGGGGGGSGLYQLNLSGTPMPLPTPVPTIPSTGGGGGGSGYMYTIVAGDTCQSIATTFNVPVEDLIGADGLPVDCAALQVDQTLTIQLAPPTLPQTVAGLRGILMVNLYYQADGSQRTEYALISADPDYPYALLEGEGLDALYDYRNRPVEVWGALTANAYGIYTVQVERFEIPFPGLDFQILKGSEQTAEVDGQMTLLFTTEDGQTFLELNSDCVIPTVPESALTTDQSAILVETLAIPDLTWGGYPTVCVHSKAPAFDASGQPVELLMSAGEVYEMNDPATYVPPTMTIEKVELVYYVNDPRFTPIDPNGPPVYIQPMWRFYGHYSNGDEFEILVQALQDVYLSPEIQPIEPPG
ncbi:MAG: LysM peptidoglycan-binding domain-containing protein [Chloroflexi bacterium]|nr:LysM peptidoglycan-binding domain-containing protein [Chloroflexota bacterium]